MMLHVAVSAYIACSVLRLGYKHACLLFWVYVLGGVQCALHGT